mgnify:CR=1 FL=1
MRDHALRRGSKRQKESSQRLGSLREHRHKGLLLRMRMLIDAAEVRPDWLHQWQDWWREFLTTMDATALLADLGYDATEIEALRAGLAVA